MAFTSQACRLFASEIEPAKPGLQATQTFEAGNLGVHFSYMAITRLKGWVGRGRSASDRTPLKQKIINFISQTCGLFASGAGRIKHGPRKACNRSKEVRIPTTAPTEPLYVSNTLNSRWGRHQMFIARLCFADLHTFEPSRPSLALTSQICYSEKANFTKHHHETLVVVASQDPKSGNTLFPPSKSKIVPSNMSHKPLKQTAACCHPLTIGL